MSTRDTSLRSAVESAEDPNSDFPIQNLPFGVFRRGTSEPFRVGIAIGDRVLDLRAAIDAGHLPGIAAPIADALSRGSLNQFAALGKSAREAVRHSVQSLLAATGPLRDSAVRSRLLVAASAVEMAVPFEIGDYSDFYASLHHATNVGSMFRPNQPLMPNWKHLPVGYHGRASSIVVSGAPVRRPFGQVSRTDDGPSVFQPSALLDYELEVGAFMGTGNDLGTRIDVDRARECLFGLVLVNDWSARDVQKWEYQPLGPFNAKNFATTVSPWVVTMEALAPFAVPGPPRSADDPPTLEYLASPTDVCYAITLEVWLTTATMRAAGAQPFLVSRGSFADMYWTFAQMVAHHTSTGCNLRTGDLVASGTVSGPTRESRGCLLERTWRGSEPLTLPDGTTRRFLEDGDEVLIRGSCSAEGARRIGFGECRGTIIPAQ